MESYRTVRTLAAVKEHMERGQLPEAYELVMQLNGKKIKNVQDLNMMARVCLQTEHYEEAKELTLQIYERTSSRRALSQLVEVAIKQGDADEAEYYLEKYEEVAKSDPTRLLYRFRIYKMCQEPLEAQIAVLEQWKSEEYAERWAYELAKLYHKAGDADRCVQECNDIILWFGEGKYVEWASVLRAYHTGEVDIETLRRYQEQIAESAKKEEAVDDKAEEALSEEPIAYETEEALPEEPLIYEAEEALPGEPLVYEAEEALPEEPLVYEAEEALSEEQSVYEAEEDLAVMQAQDDYSAERATEEISSKVAERETAVFGNTTKAEEEFDDVAVSNALAGAADEFVRMSEQYVPKMPVETKEEFEEEAIRYMQDYLGDLSTKHVVDLKGDVDSKYQPEEGGVLEAMLYERELRLEDLLGNFARMETVRKQIVRALDIIFDSHKRGNNLIITGGKASGKTALAKKIVKMLYRFQVLSATRVAIVDADKLNKMDLAEKQESLLDCCLIIERAGEMTEETVEKLLALNAAFAGRSIIFLEGDRKSINGLLRDNGELSRIFNNRIHLPEEYRPAELKGFVFDFLIEKDYEIDVYADEVLEERIRMMLGTKSTNPIRDSIAIGKEGIRNAEKRAAKNLTRMAATGNYENADIMVLHREDFI